MEWSEPRVADCLIGAFLSDQHALIAEPQGPSGQRPNIALVFRKQDRELGVWRALGKYRNPRAVSYLRQSWRYKGPIEPRRSFLGSCQPATVEITATFLVRTPPCWQLSLRTE